MKALLFLTAFSPLAHAEIEETPQALEWKLDEAQDAEKTPTLFDHTLPLHSEVEESFEIPLADELQEEPALYSESEESFEIPLADELTEESLSAEETQESPLGEIAPLAARHKAKKPSDETSLQEPKWYFEVKPGYYYFTNAQTRSFYGSGDFTIRGEAGYQLWGPVNLWFDGGYFQTDGHAIDAEGNPVGDTSLLLATLSFGFKCLWFPHERIAFYLGAAPRLFMMMLHNDSPHVRGDDNEIGIGGAFQGGFQIAPIPSYKNFFFDLFADYSWKNMEVEPDEISSDDFDVDISGLSFGIGVGVRF